MHGKTPVAAGAGSDRRWGDVGTRYLWLNAALVADARSWLIRGMPSDVLPLRIEPFVEVSEDAQLPQSFRRYLDQ
jgi:hypothetical protein